MRERVLITGGAGFIGSHLADELLEHGYDVRALDVLAEQVHGPDAGRPGYLNDDVELIVGDVRDPAKVKEAMHGVDAVFHFAAAVGVGQSMYEIRHYTDVNNVGTAVLLEEIIENHRDLKRLVVASSMSCYGEGLYYNTKWKPVEPEGRDPKQIKSGVWEILDDDGEELVPVPTPETKTMHPSSIYAQGKLDQERMCLMVGQAYGIPTAATRFFNVFGPRQALSNPYTGVLAIFASRILNGKAPLIFEDGNQRRDFVHVRDIAQACRKAMERDEAIGEVFNVGSGRDYTVMEVAEKIARALDAESVKPEVTGRFRTGDIRHCFADISKAERMLEYAPQHSLDRGLDKLAEWLETQISEDHVEDASAELAKRGLTV